MKYLVGSDIGSYSFNVTAKTITLSGVPDIVSNQVIRINNFTRNVVIYEFIKTKIVVEDGNVIQLFGTLHGMQNTDLLQIYIDIPEISTDVTDAQKLNSYTNSHLLQQILNELKTTNKLLTKIYQ